MLLTLDLFSGIGGFSLGLERTGGFRTVAFCEWDEKAQKVLRKHWQDVPITGDIKKLTVAKPINAHDKPRNYVELWYDGELIYTGLIHIITGGFPCQDISNAGKQEGLHGSRSGHFFEIIRIAGAILPEYLFMENVSGLLSVSGGRDFGTVLSSLAEIGLDAEWDCIPASYLGASHDRDRVWIIAYPGVYRRQRPLCSDFGRIKSEMEVWKAKALDSYGDYLLWFEESMGQPAVFGVDDGLPGRVDRLAQCGNAVVPYIPEMYGWAILEYEPRNQP